MHYLLHTPNGKRIRQMDKVLHKLYYDPSHPAGFGGIQTLYKHAKKKLKSLTLNQVKLWLQEQKTYTLHKPIRRKFSRRVTITATSDQQWQADLADVQTLSKYNDDFRYLLCVIDVFSRYAWVVPLKDKTSSALVQGFNKIFKMSNRIPSSLQTDKGKEFLNHGFQKFLKTHNIHYFTTENPETKASIVERFQRTLKTRMWKYFTHHKTRKYVDVLPHLVKAYNHSIHRTIQMAPASVTKENEVHVSQRFTPKSQTKDPPIHVGDLVRLNKTKKTFEKGYLPNWTMELFKITHIKPTHPPTVQVEDLSGEKIEGSFYLSEIQVIKDKEVYEIDSILARRTRTVDGKKIKEIKVHWLGYPEKFDSWIPESHLV